MNNVLEQIQNQGKYISSGPELSKQVFFAAQETSTSFSSVLTNSLSGISELQNSARQKANDFMLGSPDVGLNDVMVDMQKSSLALNFGIQTRNKMISAYQEIMSMGI